jgi:hypothetical protein
MRKNLPYYLIGARFGLDAILAVVRGLAPESLWSTYAHRIGIVLGGILLSTAFLIGMVSAILDEQRRRNAVAAALALTIHCGSIAFYLFAATTTAEIGTWKATFTVQKLAVLALGAPVPHGRELAARVAFRELGEGLQFADETGKVRTFEPSSDDLAKRESNKKMQIEGAKAQSSLRGQAMQFRAAALAGLLSLAGVLLGGAILLGGPKRWHGWLTCR